MSSINDPIEVEGVQLQDVKEQIDQNTSKYQRIELPAHSEYKASVSVGDLYLVQADGVSGLGRLESIVYNNKLEICYCHFTLYLFPRQASNTEDIQYEENEICIYNETVTVRGKDLLKWLKVPPPVGNIGIRCFPMSALEPYTHPVDKQQYVRLKESFEMKQESLQESSQDISGKPPDRYLRIPVKVLTVDEYRQFMKVRAMLNERYPVPLNRVTHNYLLEEDDSPTRVLFASRTVENETIKMSPIFKKEAHQEPDTSSTWLSTIKRIYQLGIEYACSLFFNAEVSLDGTKKNLLDVATSGHGDLYDLYHGKLSNKLQNTNEKNYLTTAPEQGDSTKQKGCVLQSHYSSINLDIENVENGMSEVKDVDHRGQNDVWVILDRCEGTTTSEKHCHAQPVEVLTQVEENTCHLSITDHSPSLGDPLDTPRKEQPSKVLEEEINDDNTIVESATLQKCHMELSLHENEVNCQYSSEFKHLDMPESKIIKALHYFKSDSLPNQVKDPLLGLVDNYYASACDTNENDKNTSLDLTHSLISNAAFMSNTVSPYYKSAVNGILTEEIYPQVDCTPQAGQSVLSKEGPWKPEDHIADIIQNDFQADEEHMTTYLEQDRQQTLSEALLMTCGPSQIIDTSSPNFTQGVMTSEPVFMTTGPGLMCTKQDTVNLYPLIDTHSLCMTGPTVNFYNPQPNDPGNSFLSHQYSLPTSDILSYPLFGNYMCDDVNLDTIETSTGCLTDGTEFWDVISQPLTRTKITSERKRKCDSESDINLLARISSERSDTQVAKDNIERRDSESDLEDVGPSTQQKRKTVSYLN